jgi:hypothetical protein
VISPKHQFSTKLYKLDGHKWNNVVIMKSTIKNKMLVLTAVTMVAAFAAKAAFNAPASKFTSKSLYQTEDTARTAKPTDRSMRANVEQRRQKALANFGDALLRIGEAMGTGKSDPKQTSGSGPKPDIDYSSKLGDIADRLNAAADAGTIAEIEKDLAKLEKAANGSLNPERLAVVKSGLEEKKAEISSNGSPVPNAAAGDSSANARETGAPAGVETEFDNGGEQGKLQPTNTNRDFGAELGNIVDRLNAAADARTIAEIEKDLAKLEKDANGSLNPERLAVVKSGLEEKKAEFNAAPALPAASDTSSQQPGNSGQQAQDETGTAMASPAAVNPNVADTAKDANAVKGTVLPTKEEMMDSVSRFVDELNAIAQYGATNEQKCALWERIGAFVFSAEKTLSTNEDATLMGLLGVLKGANEDLKKTINE